MRYFAILAATLAAAWPHHDMHAKATEALEKVSEKLAKSAAADESAVSILDKQAQETAEHEKEEAKAFEDAFGYKVPEHERDAQPSSFVEEDGDADSQLHRTFAGIDGTRDEMHKMDKEVRHELADFKHSAERAARMLHDVETKRTQRANAYRNGKIAAGKFPRAAPSSFLETSETPLSSVEASLADLQKGIQTQLATFTSEAQKTALAEQLAMKKMNVQPRTSFIEEPDSDDSSTEASSDDSSTDTASTADSSAASTDDSSTGAASADDSSAASTDDSSTDTASSASGSSDKSGGDSSADAVAASGSDSDSSSSTRATDDSSTDTAAETTSDAGKASDSDTAPSDASSDDSTSDGAKTSDASASDSDDSAAKSVDADDKKDTMPGQESDEAKAEDETQAALDKAHQLDEHIKEETAKLLQEARGGPERQIEHDRHHAFSLTEKRAHHRLVTPKPVKVDAEKDLDAFDTATNDVGDAAKKMEADSEKFMANMDAITSDAGPSSFVQKGRGIASATAEDTLAEWKAKIEQRAGEQKRRAQHLAKLMKAPLDGKAPSFMELGETVLSDEADDDLGDGLESKIDELDQKSRDGMEQLDGAVHTAYSKLGDADAVSAGLDSMSPLATPDRFAAATDPLGSTDPLSPSSFSAEAADAGSGFDGLGSSSLDTPSISSDLPSTSLSTGDDSLGASSDIGDSDLGSSDIGESSDIGGSDLGSSDLGSSELGSSDIGASSDIGGSDIGSSDLGSSEIDAPSPPDLGSSDIGASSDMGDSDIGSSDLGSSDIDAPSPPDLGDSDISSAGTDDGDLTTDIGAESLLETSSKTQVKRTKDADDQLRKHS